MGVYKYIQTINPYSGIAESAETSQTLFTGDAAMVAYSLTTSSGTASRWTMMGHGGDGFFASLDATQWQPVNTVTAQGFYSLATIPRWVAFQRTVSHSSTSFLVSIYVGP